MKYWKLLLSLLFLTQFNTQVIADGCKGPGVAITFDDYAVYSWYNARQMFITHNAKATFFISNSYSMNEDEFGKLRTLQDDGHEMGSHTLDHRGIKSNYYNDPSLTEEYLDEQIIPSIKDLESHGLKISSFAHPFGQYTKEYNERLLLSFLFVRATTYSFSDSLHPPFYSRNNPSGLIYGIGIDSTYNNSIDQIRDGMIRARDNNEVLILYGHAIADDGWDYQTPTAKLEEILASAEELGLEFYTISELETLCISK